eukprot:m.113815 g.113815  ORF g.113815 m.113815 type:complete len:519 (-) comp28298_c0_seq1:161-1717(-)
MPRYTDLFVFTVAFVVGVVYMGKQDPELEISEGREYNVRTIKISRKVLDVCGFRWVHSPHLEYTGVACIGTKNVQHTFTNVHPVFDVDTEHTQLMHEVFELAQTRGIMMQFETETSDKRFDQHGVGEIDLKRHEECPYGTYLIKKADPAISAARCQIGPRYSDVTNYVFSGGGLGRQESARALVQRSRQFQLRLSAKMIKQEFNGSALEKLLHNANLANAAANMNQSDGEYSHVAPSHLVIDVYPPGIEAPSTTDAPEYDNVPAKRFPQWLRSVMRHSCLFESQRIRTVKAMAWWGPDEPTSTTETQPHKLVTYNEGPFSAGSVWNTATNKMTLFDGQTVMHRVTTNNEADNDGLANNDGPAIPCDLPEGTTMFRSDDTEQPRWFLRAPNGTTIISYPANQVSIALSWEAAVFKTAEAQKTWVKRRIPQQPFTVDGTLSEMLKDMRLRGKMKYSEHLLQKQPTRLRKKLADALVKEYVVYPEDANQMTFNFCALLERAPIVARDILMLVTNCDSTCMQ